MDQMMRTDHMTMRLLALMPMESNKAIERILEAYKLSDGHHNEELTLPEGYADEHGIRYCGVRGQHHGDRLSSHIIFRSGIVWDDGGMFIQGDMPDTMLQALKVGSLDEITGSDIFSGVEIIDVERQNPGVMIHTDVESLLRLVDAEGAITIT